MAPRIEPMPPITTTANTTITSEVPICGVHQHDRRRQHAGERGERHAAAVGGRDQQRHVDAEGLQQRRILGGGAQRRAQAGALDDEPGAEAHRDRRDDHPGPIDRQDHEAEIDRAGERGGHRIGLAGGAEHLVQRAFDDERQAEGQQQTVQRIEPVQMAQEQPLDDDAEQADRQRREHQRGPVVDAEQLQPEQRGERAERVEGAVGEIDDAHQAEDHRQPEAQQRVERAVHQPEHQLAEDDGDRNAEDVAHGRSPDGAPLAGGCAADAGAAHGYLGASGHRPVIGPNASSPVISLTTL